MTTKIKILGLIFSAMAISAFIAACSNPADINDDRYFHDRGPQSPPNNTPQFPPNTGPQFPPNQPDNNGGENDIKTPPIGHNLTLKGQVWYLDDDTKNYFHFMGDRADIKAHVHGGYVVSEPNGTGTITDGQLNFNIGTPSLLLPSYMIKTITTNDTALSPAETQFGVFFWLYTEYGETPTSYNHTYSGTHGVDYTEVQELFIFLYVDQDATMSSFGGDSWFDDTSFHGITHFQKHEPYTIKLHAGWNIIKTKTEIVDTSTHNGKTHYVSLANLADLKWKMSWLATPSKPFLQM